jgi:uncharacterized delta-60 repeat protein
MITQNIFTTFFCLFLCLSRFVLATDGDLDPTFGGDGIVVTDFKGWDKIQAITIQSDGKIVSAGHNSFGGNFLLARYNNDGTLDNTFGTHGKIINDFGSFEICHAVAMQDDKIVAAGYSSAGAPDFIVARYRSNGSLDNTFNQVGYAITDILGGVDIAKAIAVQSDGKIIVAGYTYHGSKSNGVFALMRYNNNGSLDTSFDGDGIVTTDFYPNKSDKIFALAIQTDGKIVAVGSTGQSSDFAVARYNADGTLDYSFDQDGKTTTTFGPGSLDSPYSVAIQSDGKIVVAGVTTRESQDFALARYNTDGSLDTDFDADGRLTTDFAGDRDVAYAVAIQSDNRIVAVGVTKLDSIDFAMTRYMPDGTLDSSFNNDGKLTTDLPGINDAATAAAIQMDGKIVAAGSTSDNFALARYENNPNTPPVAVNDRYSTLFNRRLFVPSPGVLGNDSDVDGNLLKAALKSRPRYGTVTFNSDGSFRYSPKLGFIGTDRFSYIANDGLADSNVAIVEIKVDILQ